ncbi:MAG TPA: SDR family NAD(P)-dependent oxidoreductase [Bacteroidetes bacterium]|nr:SDR family NAD(P)-dependent oxidoreductase [Bacteroidota bacterium]
MNDERYTLITGAGQGLGKAFALECAKRHFNLLLLALPGEKLESFALSLRKNYVIKTDYLEIDLTEPQAAGRIYHWVHDHHYVLNRIINNAGIGSVGSFTSHDPAFYDKQLDLNIKAVVLLIHYFIEELAAEPDARILNISSLASFFAMPYKAVYASSKGFIYYFSRALRMEYLNTPLRISVACPGPIITNRQVIKRIKDQGRISRIMVLSPEKTARLCLRGMLRGKAFIIPGFPNKFLYWIEKLLPQFIKIKFVASRLRNNPPS